MNNNIIKDIDELRNKLLENDDVAAIIATFDIRTGRADVSIQGGPEETVCMLLAVVDSVLCHDNPVTRKVSREILIKYMVGDISRDDLNRRSSEGRTDIGTIKNVR